MLRIRVVSYSPYSFHLSDVALKDVVYKTNRRSVTFMHYFFRSLLPSVSHFPLPLALMFAAGTGILFALGFVALRSSFTPWVKPLTKYVLMFVGGVFDSALLFLFIGVLVEEFYVQGTIFETWVLLYIIMGVSVSFICIAPALLAVRNVEKEFRRRAAKQKIE